MYQEEKNIQIGQNHRRTGMGLLLKREGWIEERGGQEMRGSIIGCKDSVLCILKANLCILELDLYHSSVHTIQSDLCKPTGHQFSNQMAIGYSFHLMHFLHSHQSLAAWFLDCLLKQTNTGNCSHTNKTKMIPSDKGDFLVFQSIPLIP